MNHYFTLSRYFLPILVPISLFVIAVVLIKSVLSAHRIMDLAITVDLVVTIPLIYFLVIRKTSIPKTTALPIMVVGLLLGSYFLPLENQQYLTYFKTWALPVVELAVVTYVILTVRRALKTYRSIKGEKLDFYDALLRTCNSILPKRISNVLATELAVIYYGFIDWSSTKSGNNDFSYHKKSGTPALLGAFIFVIGIETFVLHLLISSWSSWVAWIITGISIYTAIQVLGILKSLAKRPVSLHPNHLTLRYGILNEVKIPIRDIQEIELSKKPIEKDPLTRRLSPLGELEGHNILLHLRNEKKLIGLYGIKRRFQTLMVYLDEPEDFHEKVKAVIHH